MATVTSYVRTRAAQMGNRAPVHTCFSFRMVRSFVKAPTPTLQRDCDFENNEDKKGSCFVHGVQVLRQYARESYGLVTQAGWCKDSEAYLLMLRVAVDMQLACESGSAGGAAAESDSDPGELLRDVLREWSLQTRDVGAHRLTKKKNTRS